MSSVKNVIQDSYKLMLLKDYLREAIKEAGFSDVDIQKTPTGTRVGLHVTRPELEPSVMCNRMSQHIARGTAFRRAVMWTLQTIMEAGAMGVQITISGKLRGERSGFEKHSKGILPRAGYQAGVVVAEDVVHVETKMGLIGIRIRIARKEKFVPEFELKIATKELKQKPKAEEEKEIEVVEEAQIDKTKPRTESEEIEREEKLIKEVETYEDVEEELK